MLRAEADAERGTPLCRAFDAKLGDAGLRCSHREAACHEQAVFTPRVEWLPGLGSNQRPSD